MNKWRVIQGDCLDVLRALPAESVQCCVTSPPYWGLRDYECKGQLGLEKTPEAYTAKLVEVFREVRRLLTDDGTLWLNLGDCYCTVPHGPLGANSSDPKAPGARERHGSQANRLPQPNLKHKDLVGIPWRVAFALQADGWWLRSDIIWAKPNPMPESVTDRPTRSHGYLFLLTKSARYFYDYKAVKEPAVGKNTHDLTGPGYSAPGQPPQTGNRKALRSATESRHRSSVPGGQDLRANPGPTRNRRSVWTITPEPFKGAHFAVMPKKLVEPCILAGSRSGDTVLDPFTGSGTVGAVAIAQGRGFVGVELNPGYVKMARRRIGNVDPLSGKFTIHVPKAVGP